MNRLGKSTDDIKFSYKDLLDIFGEESKIELINGKITIGDRSFDEVIEKYLQIKAIKKSGNS